MGTAATQGWPDRSGSSSRGLGGDGALAGANGGQIPYFVRRQFFSLVGRAVGWSAFCHHLAGSGRGGCGVFFLAGVGKDRAGKLSFAAILKMFVALEPCDMRKGFNGLHMLVTEKLGEDPRAGALFVFNNRRRLRLKIPAR